MPPKKLKIKIKTKNTKPKTNSKPKNSNSNSNSNFNSNTNTIENVSESNTNNEIGYAEPSTTSLQSPPKTTSRKNSEPLFWMEPNKKEFPAWINKTFLKYRLTNKAPKQTKGDFKPFPYQEFARDYMQESSPYRGLLLYHGLGSGKCVLPETHIFVNNYYQRADEIWNHYTNLSSTSLIVDNDPKTPGAVWADLNSTNSNLTTLSLNEKTKTLTKTTVSKLYRQPINELVRTITLRNGSVIRLTQAHKLLTSSTDWCQAKDLKKGDFVAIPQTINGESQAEPPLTVADMLYSREIYFSKITNITDIQYEGFVYDFEVKTHHNYVANNILCHNTCTAIGIAENLKDRNKIVILPASLKANFIGTPKKEGLRFCGDPKYASSNDLINSRYTFVSSNASNSLQQLLKLGSLDNTVIIIDEVHNLISMMTSTTAKQGKEFYHRLMDAKNIKMICLSGTPIVNFAFEAAIMLNLLRGYIEMLVFEIRYLPPAYSSSSNLKPIIDDLENLPNVDYVDHNITGKTFDIHLTIKSWHAEFQETINAIKDRCLTNHDIKLFYRTTQNYTLYPDDEEEFHKYFMDSTDLRDEKIKNKDLFQRRMMGLVSYYRGAKPEFYPTVKPVKFVRVPMSNYQFGLYELIRSIERTQESRSSTKGRGFAKLSHKGSSQLQVSSTFRVFSREFSNFVFPKDISRPFPRIDYIKAATKNQKTEPEVSKKSADANANDELEVQTNKKEISRVYQARIQKALAKLWANHKEYLTPTTSGLNVYSPKMRMMLELINRTPGTQLVYSDFRSLEGAQIFSMVLAANGYTAFNQNYSYHPTKPNKHKFALWTGTEDHDERRKILTTFNSEKNKHGELIKAIIITSAGAEGIDLKNVRGVHIMDPYWNEVRSDQVIGRAVRVNSHVDLPVKERTVTVYRYLSVFTPQQIKETREKVSTDDYLQH